MILKRRLLGVPPGRSLTVDTVRDKLSRAREIDVSEAAAYLRSVSGEREFGYEVFPNVRPGDATPLFLEARVGGAGPGKRVAYLVEARSPPPGEPLYDRPDVAEVLTLVEFHQGAAEAYAGLPPLFRIGEDVGTAPYALVLPLGNDGRVVGKSGGNQQLSTVPFIDVPVGVFAPMLEAATKWLYTPLFALSCLNAARGGLARVEKVRGGEERLRIEGLRRKLNASYKARELGLGRALTVGRELFSDGGPARDGRKNVAGEGGTSLRAEFEGAAEEHGVPVELLLAMGYVNTRWEMPPPETTPYMPGDEHGRGAYGLMQLYQRPGKDTLGRAASLTGLSEEELKRDRAANVRGGAAALADARGPADPAGLWGWREAVAAYGDGPLYVDQVFEVLRSGASGTTSDGERLVLPPQDTGA